MENNILLAIFVLLAAPGARAPLGQALGGGPGLGGGAFIPPPHGRNGYAHGFFLCAGRRPASDGHFNVSGKP